MRDVVLLDLGNVLVPFDYKKGAAAFAQLTGLAPHDLHGLMTGPKLHDICAGALHPHALFDEMAARAQRPLERADTERAWCDIFTPDAETIALAGRLAAKYETHLWSNIDPLHRAWLWPQLPVLAKFRALHLSYELGAAKPAPEFYARALERGGIDPQRAVFVDDVPANLETAATFGIATVLHTSARETEAALAKLGVTA